MKQHLKKTGKKYVQEVKSECCRMWGLKEINYLSFHLLNSSGWATYQMDRGRLTGESESVNTCTWGICISMKLPKTVVRWEVRYEAWCGACPGVLKSGCANIAFRSPLYG